MVMSGKKMFKFKKCGKDTFTYYEVRKGVKWCSAKLPCGRCVTVNFNPRCSHLLEGYHEFDCDNCPHKFKCLTNGNKYEDHTWVDRKKRSD